MNALTKRFLVGLSVALSLSISTAWAPATVVYLHDDFNGPGTEPDPVWVQSEVNGGTVALSGGYCVATTTGGPFEVAGFDARSVAQAPTASISRQLLFTVADTAGKPVSLYMGLDTGPGAPSGQGITLDHQAGGNWFVEIGGGLWTSPLTQAAGIDGDWLIDWYPNLVRFYRNGSLFFDSSVTPPNSGSWTIPTTAAFPNFVAYNTSATGFKIDSVTFQNPEPGGMIFSVIALAALASSRRRVLRGAGK